jgi:hypothetical protein
MKREVGLHLVAMLWGYEALAKRRHAKIDESTHLSAAAQTAASGSMHDRIVRGRDRPNIHVLSPGLPVMQALETAASGSVAKKRT